MTWRVGWILLAAAGVVLGQTKPGGGVAVQGSLRSRTESWDWFEGAGDNAYSFSGNILRLSISQNKAPYDWQIELAAPVLLGLPSGAIAPGAQGQLGMGGTYYAANGSHRNSAMVFPKQAFIRFHHLGGGEAHSIRLGRFEFTDGSEMTPKNATLAALKRDRINQRLLGHFGFTHVGRSFDGAHYAWNKASGNVTLIGALPTRGVFQTDGWGWTNTAFGYGSYTKPWGKGGHAAETRVLALYYQDWRGILKTDSRSLADRRADLADVQVATFGGHHLSAFTGPSGTADLLLWGVAQTGKWGRLDHRANAISVEAGFQPKIMPKCKPWLRGGVFQGSGDSDPTDSRHGTFFQVLPTPRPFARFPFFNLMNNRDLMAMLVLRPHKDVTVSTEFHALRLSSVRDLWYLGGGAFQPWTFGYTGRATGGAKSLANLHDVSVEYRARPAITVTGYLGVAAGRAVMHSIYPRGANGLLGYVELMYKFELVKP